MQVFNPEFKVINDSTGHYIQGYGIGTKFNEAEWGCSPAHLSHEVGKYLNTDFAIIPELIHTPIREGGGGHYFGNDSLEDLRAGYAKASHAKVVKILGPYPYPNEPDNSQEYFYKFRWKLRDSLAGSVLQKEGDRTWIKYSVSPHFKPLTGPNHRVETFDAVGSALVIKGAAGPMSVIEKMCIGSAAACDQSLAGSGIKPCDDLDKECAEIISSHLSKAGSINSMSVKTDNDPNANQAGKIESLETKIIDSSGKVSPENLMQSVSNASDVKSLTAAELQKLLADAKAEAVKEKEDRILALEIKDKTNTLNRVFSKVTDEKVKKDLTNKYVKFDNVDIIEEALNDILPYITASLKAELEASVVKDDSNKNNKSKAGSSLREEPKLADDKKSKAGSVTNPETNEVAVIDSFMMSGGMSY